MRFAHRAAQLLLVAAAALCGQSSAASCPYNWLDVGGGCLLFVQPQRGSFSAEDYCKRNAAHLLTVLLPEHVALLRAYLLRHTVTTKIWIGLTQHRQAGGLAWLSGHPDTSFVMDSGLSPVNSSASGCVAVELSPDGALEGVVTPCSTLLPSACLSGTTEDLWETSEFVIEDAFVGRDLDAADVQVRSLTRVVEVNGVEVAVGTWVQPNVFRVKTGFPCIWMIQVVATGWAHAGCEAYFGVLGDDPRYQWRRMSDLRRLVILPCDGGNQHSTPAPKSTIPTPTAVPSPGTVPARGDAEETGENTPSWVWPIAFVLVMLASALAAVAAGGKRKRRPRKKKADQQQDPPQQQQQQQQQQHSAASNASSTSDRGFEGIVHDGGVRVIPVAPASAADGCDRTSSAASVGPSVSEGSGAGGRGRVAAASSHAESSEACAVCHKFNVAQARDRLSLVHGLLAAELREPLVVNSTECVHGENEHHHVFTVGTKLHAMSLGALATVYSSSRVGQKLPRNTRIHIQFSSEGRDDT
ncbi:hypothetical protein DIPPA_08915 [Diplonema papillatum]|nr:hypothetical protein DIPPA_08915 [Diplonema papillatum]